MEIYKGQYAKALMNLSRSERENIMRKILEDDRLNFEAKLSNSPTARLRTANALLMTRSLHPDAGINKILVDWVCQGMAERYVLIAQLALMNSQRYEDANP